MATAKGHYLTMLERGETPPTFQEIADRVGCDVGTVSRAVGGLEAKRKRLARQDANDRYSESG